MIGTPYHQNSNSVETSVKEVQRILSTIISDKNQWKEFIPVVQIIRNTRITRVTDSKPFELMFGRPFVAKKEGNTDTHPFELQIKDWAAVFVVECYFRVLGLDCKHMTWTETVYLRLLW